MYKLPFVFGFSTDDDMFHEHFFCINVPNKDEVKDLADIIAGEEFDAFIRKSEDKYGVHDYSCRQPFACGFDSYEVEEDNFDELMSGLKQFFIDKSWTISDEEVHAHNEDEDTYENTYAEKVLDEMDVKVCDEYFWLV